MRLGRRVRRFIRSRSVGGLRLGASFSGPFAKFYDFIDCERRQHAGKAEYDDRLIENKHAYADRLRYKPQRGGGADGDE